MKRIGQLKDEALDALHGNFGKAALATLVVTVISCAISVSLFAASGGNYLDYIDAISDMDYAAMAEAAGGDPLISLIQFVINVLFITPLTIGVANTYRVLVQSKGSDNDIIGNYFKLAFGKHYWHIVLVSFVSGLLIGLMMVPAIVILILIIILAHNVVVSVIFSIAALVFIIIIGLMYSQISLIILDDPKLDIIDTMRRSRTLMNGYKWKLFVLELSFLGWIIVGIFTLCIGYLWLAPYISATEAAFYCDIKGVEDETAKVEEA